MSFTPIDLDKVGVPQIIDQLDPEVILAERKARLLELAEARGDAEYAAGLAATLELESDPLVIQLEEDSYREATLRQDIQDAGLGNMLAFAHGATLDYFGSLFGVVRQVVQEADETANPPVPEVLEDDERFRKRIQLAPEGFTTTGTPGSYKFWGLTASPVVKDIDPSETQKAGEVLLTVLSTEGDGTPDAALLARVGEVITPRKPLGAELIVSAPQIQTYQIHAVLTLYSGPDGEVVRQAAEDALRTYTTKHHKLGHDITIAGLHAALFREGVQNVDLGAFNDDLVVGAQGAAYCTDISVTIGGRNV